MILCQYITATLFDQWNLDINQPIGIQENKLMIFWPIEMQKKDEERMAQEKKVKVLEDAKKQQEEGRLLGRIKIYIKYYT